MAHKIVKFKSIQKCLEFLKWGISFPAFRKNWIIYFASDLPLLGNEHSRRKDGNDNDLQWELYFIGLFAF